jgi:hypothetical protein
MREAITSITTWVQRLNFTNKSKEILKNFLSLVKALGPLPPNTSPISMFHGSRITELAACGLTLDPCACGLEACRLKLDQVGSKA